jgi:hypothetical protein
MKKPVIKKTIKKPATKTRKKPLPKAQFGETIDGFLYDVGQSHKRRVGQVKNAIKGTADAMARGFIKFINPYGEAQRQKQIEMMRPKWEEYQKKRQLKSLEENRKIGFEYARQAAELKRKRAEAAKKQKAKKKTKPVKLKF